MGHLHHGLEVCAIVQCRGPLILLHPLTIHYTRICRSYSIKCVGKVPVQVGRNSSLSGQRLLLGGLVGGCRGSVRGGPYINSLAVWNCTSASPHLNSSLATFVALSFLIAVPFATVQRAEDGALLGQEGAGRAETVAGMHLKQASSVPVLALMLNTLVHPDVLPAGFAVPAYMFSKHTQQ